VTIRGAVGSVRWGYHRAADVRQWHATLDPKTQTWQLGGQVAHADPFLGTRSELVFVVALKGGRAWQWPVRALAIGGGQLRATLGPLLK